MKMNRIGNFAGARMLLVALVLAVAGPLGSPVLLGIGRETGRQQGHAVVTRSEYDSIIAYLSEAIQRDPTRAGNYFNRGMIYTLEGDNDKAIADFTEAIRINPHEAVFYYNRGLACVAKGDNTKDAAQYDVAIPDFDEAIQLDPRYAEAFYSRGYAYAAKGAYDRAIADYGETTQLVPGNTEASNNLAAEAYNNLAWILATCPQPGFRDGKKAVLNATKACELTQWQEAAALDTLAAAYAETGDFTNAVKWENVCLAVPNIDPSIVPDAKTRLALYQAHQPYHETQNSFPK